MFGVPHFQHAWFASGFLLVDEESLHCVRLVCMQRQYRRARYLGQCFRPQACCTLAAPGSKADLKTANVRRETFGKRESGRSSIHIFDDGHLLKSAGWVHPLEAHSLDNQYIYMCVCVSMCVCIMYIYYIYICITIISFDPSLRSCSHLIVLKRIGEKQCWGPGPDRPTVFWTSVGVIFNMCNLYVFPSIPWVNIGWK